MIDINTPAAQAKLATLPEEMRDDIHKLAHMASERIAGLGNAALELEWFAWTRCST